MNQNQILKINLAELIGTKTPYGNREGKTAFNKLTKELELNPLCKIIEISFKGISRIDVSFPRESVISVVKLNRNEKGFVLRDFKTQDLLDNCDYAAKAKEQPLVVVENNGFKVIGPELSSGAMELLQFIMDESSATTSTVADKFGVSSQNASGKLKKLYSQGLILGSKEVAESGGLEFIYRAIKA